MKKSEDVRKHKLLKRGVMSDAEMVYCEEKARGGSDRDAYLKAWPNTIGVSDRAIELRINRLNKKQEVVRRIAEIRKRFADKVAGKYDGLKEKLIDKMVEAIDAITDGNPSGMVACVPMVKQISTMMGYDAAQKVDVRNGGLAPDYNPPMNVLEMTEEQLMQMIGGSHA